MGRIKVKGYEISGSPVGLQVREKKKE